MPFNVEKAREMGGTDEQIAQYLAKTRNYRYDEAIKAGVTHKEVINYLAPQKSAEAKPAEVKPPAAPAAPPGPPPLNEPIFKEAMGPAPTQPVPPFDKALFKEAVESTAAKPEKATEPPVVTPPGMAVKPVEPAKEVEPVDDVKQTKEVTPPFAARHPYLAAIPPTLWETAKASVPFGKYAGEEGREELKGDFFPTGTTTDPEKLKEIEKELVTGKKKISPYESLAKETLSAAELAAFPTAARVTGAIGEEILPAALTRFLKTPIGPWLRSLTNKERGLATQSLEDMLNRGYSEADVLRRWNNPSWREEALRRRNKGEEYPPFVEAGKPAEPGAKITPPGVAPEALEPVGSTIPGGTPAPGPTTEMGNELPAALPPGQRFQPTEPKPEEIARPKPPPEAPEPVGTTIPMGMPPITPEPKPVEAPAPAAPIPPMIGMVEAPATQPQAPKAVEGQEPAESIIPLAAPSVAPGMGKITQSLPPIAESKIAPTKEAVEKPTEEAALKAPAEASVKIDLAEFQATPEKFIPDDMMVEVKAIREKTGKEITIKQSAKEAFDDSSERLKRFREFLDCVKT